MRVHGRHRVFRLLPSPLHDDRRYLEAVLFVRFNPELGQWTGY